MNYEVMIDGELEKKFKKIHDVNLKEYNIVTRKIDEIKEHSKITINHKNKFNSFEKPLGEYKWVEIGNKILIFKINPDKKYIHLCEYLPKDEVFE